MDAESYNVPLLLPHPWDPSQPPQQQQVAIVLLPSQLQLRLPSAQPREPAPARAGSDGEEEEETLNAAPEPLAAPAEAATPKLRWLVVSQLHQLLCSPSSPYAALQLMVQQMPTQDTFVARANRIMHGELLQIAPPRGKVCPLFQKLKLMGAIHWKASKANLVTLDRVEVLITKVGEAMKLCLLRLANNIEFAIPRAQVSVVHRTHPSTANTTSPAALIMP